MTAIEKRLDALERRIKPKVELPFMQDGVIHFAERAFTEEEFIQALEQDIPRTILVEYVGKMRGEDERHNKLQGSVLDARITLE